MQKQAGDFRSSQTFGHIVYFQEGVDIHHIFPKAWCEARKPKKIAASDYDSVINKTPLTYRTNRIIGGDAPSIYLAKLENGKPGLDGYPPLAKTVLDDNLKSHLIPVAQLRADDFDVFMSLRQAMLMDLIASVTHNAVPAASAVADTGDDGKDLPDDIARDSGIAVEESS